MANSLHAESRTTTVLRSPPVRGRGTMPSFSCFPSSSPSPPEVWSPLSYPVPSHFTRSTLLLDDDDDDNDDVFERGHTEAIATTAQSSPSPEQSRLRVNVVSSSQRGGESAKKKELDDEDSPYVMSPLSPQFRPRRSGVSTSHHHLLTPPLSVASRPSQPPPARTAAPLPGRTVSGPRTGSQQSFARVADKVGRSSTEALGVARGIPSSIIAMLAPTPLAFMTGSSSSEDDDDNDDHGSKDGTQQHRFVHTAAPSNPAVARHPTGDPVVKKGAGSQCEESVPMATTRSPTHRCCPTATSMAKSKKERSTDLHSDREGRIADHRVATAQSGSASHEQRCLEAALRRTATAYYIRLDDDDDDDEEAPSETVQAARDGNRKKSTEPSCAQVKPSRVQNTPMESEEREEADHTTPRQQHLKKSAAFSARPSQKPRSRRYLNLPPRRVRKKTVGHPTSASSCQKESPSTLTCPPPCRIMEDSSSGQKERDRPIKEKDSAEESIALRRTVGLKAQRCCRDGEEEVADDVKEERGRQDNTHDSSSGSKESVALATSENLCERRCRSPPTQTRHPSLIRSRRKQGGARRTKEMKSREKEDITVDILPLLFDRNQFPDSSRAAAWHATASSAPKPPLRLHPDEEEEAEEPRVSELATSRTAAGRRSGLPASPPRVSLLSLTKEQQREHRIALAQVLKPLFDPAAMASKKAFEDAVSHCLPPSHILPPGVFWKTFWTEPSRVAPLQESTDNVKESGGGRPSRAIMELPQQQDCDGSPSLEFVGEGSFGLVWKSFVQLPNAQTNPSSLPLAPHSLVRREDTTSSTLLSRTSQWACAKEEETDEGSPAKKPVQFSSQEAKGGGQSQHTAAAHLLSRVHRIPVSIKSCPLHLSSKAQREDALTTLREVAIMTQLQHLPGGGPDGAGIRRASGRLSGSSGGSTRNSCDKPSSKTPAAAPEQLRGKEEEEEEEDSTSSFQEAVVVVPHTLPLYSAFYVPGAAESIPPHVQRAMAWGKRCRRQAESLLQEALHSLESRTTLPGRPEYEALLEEMATQRLPVLERDPESKYYSPTAAQERARYSGVRLPNFLALSPQEALGSDGTLFLVMEQCEGDVEQLVKQSIISPFVLRSDPPPPKCQHSQSPQQHGCVPAQQQRRVHASDSIKASKSSPCVTPTLEAATVADLGGRANSNSAELRWSSGRIPHTAAVRRPRRRPLPAPLLFPMAVCVSEALAGLHILGLIHLDVKPSNILYSYLYKGEEQRSEASSPQHLLSDCTAVDSTRRVPHGQHDETSVVGVSQETPSGQRRSSGKDKTLLQGSHSPPYHAGRGGLRSPPQDGGSQNSVSSTSSGSLSQGREKRIRFYLSDFGNCRLVLPPTATASEVKKSSKGRKRKDTSQKAGAQQPPGKGITACNSASLPSFNLAFVSGAVGTYAYMDLRALEASEVSTATDCFSLGATLYELAFGLRVYSTAAARLAVLSQQYPSRQPPQLGEGGGSHHTSRVPLSGALEESALVEWKISLQNQQQSFYDGLSQNPPQSLTQPVVYPSRAAEGCLQPLENQDSHGRDCLVEEEVVVCGDPLLLFRGSVTAKAAATAVSSSSATESAGRGTSRAKRNARHSSNTTNSSKTEPVDPQRPEETTEDAPQSATEGQRDRKQAAATAARARKRGREAASSSALLLPVCTAVNQGEKKRGRPRKTAAAVSTTPSVPVSSVEEDEEEEPVCTAVNQGKTKRGRPRKTAAAVLTTPAVPVSSVEEDEEEERDQEWYLKLAQPFYKETLMAPDPQQEGEAPHTKEKTLTVGLSGAESNSTHGSPPCLLSDGGPHRGFSFSSSTTQRFPFEAVARRSVLGFRLLPEVLALLHAAATSSVMSFSHALLELPLGTRVNVASATKHSPILVKTNTTKSSVDTTTRSTPREGGEDGLEMEDPYLDSSPNHKPGGRGGAYAVTHSRLAFLYWEVLCPLLSKEWEHRMTAEECVAIFRERHIFL